MYNWKDDDTKMRLLAAATKQTFILVKPKMGEGDVTIEKCETTNAKK